MSQSLIYGVLPYLGSLTGSGRPSDRSDLDMDSSVGPAYGNQEGPAYAASGQELYVLISDCGEADASE